MLRLAVRKDTSLGLKDQIKRQIRAAIASGSLARGERIPSSHDLATMLHVNRNTVAQAYRELALEGYMESTVGSGTVVSLHAPEADTSGISDMVRQMLQEARHMGFSEEQLLDELIAAMATSSRDSSEKRVLVVDCSIEAVDFMRSRIEAEIGAVTSGMLIQDVEADPEEALARARDADLIVCGLSYLEDLRAAIPGCTTSVLGVMLRPDIRVVRELLRLAPGSTAGYCCSNQRSAETLYRSSLFDHGVELRRVIVGLDDSERARTLLEPCSVIFVTSPNVQRLTPILRSDQRVVKVDIDLEPGGIDLIREMLTG
jgi:DNA-binding transcriptional regulator YhcF (GntR family)